MIKRSDSIRSLGHVMINVDKPLRAKLKALAEAEGVPLVQYLRDMADKELSNKQGSLPLGGGGTREATLTSIKQDTQEIVDLNTFLVRLLVTATSPRGFTDVEFRNLKASEIIARSDQLEASIKEFFTRKDQADLFDNLKEANSEA